MKTAAVKTDRPEDPRPHAAEGGTRYLEAYMSARGRLSTRELAAWPTRSESRPRSTRTAATPARPPLTRALAAALLGTCLVLLVAGAVSGSTAMAWAAVTAWIGVVSTVSAVCGHSSRPSHQR
ncbi:hypothetical protein [Streptomyces sp. NPDC058279]|uniref:hypothetical protein n=1 Tax=Streptomyces sp. NPDC058279 TaxID=3346418 RepID=UPI0036DFB090